MKARDVMVSPVTTVKQGSSIHDLAALLTERGISAVPVIDENDRIVGIVSEADLLHRSENDTERRRSWLQQTLCGDYALANEYAKAHTRKVSDVMTRAVITAAPETPLHEIATLMEKHSIKRVPILEKGQLVGIVSRANLVQAVASARKTLDISVSDTAIREKLLAHLDAQAWARTGLINIVVTNGIVDLYGITRSDSEREAIRIAAEAMPGVAGVNDNLITRPATGWM